MQLQPVKNCPMTGKIHAFRPELAAIGCGLTAGLNPSPMPRGGRTRRHLPPSQCSTSAPQYAPPVYGWPSAHASSGPVAATSDRLSPAPQCATTLTIRHLAEPAPGTAASDAELTVATATAPAATPASPARMALT